MEYFCIYCGNMVEASYISDPNSTEFIGLLYICFQCDKEVSEYNNGKIIGISRSTWPWRNTEEDEEG